MVGLPEEKLLYTEIQKKLYYIIPEKWESIYLYASIIDVPNQKPVGEMYFYYLPKGIIKKKFINSYEIPSLFNIDEEQYSKMITNVYNQIKQLRECYQKNNRRVWSSVTISIEHMRFKIEFDYSNILDSEFNSYERHLVWRYLYLKEDIEIFKRSDKKIIETYMDSTEYRKGLNKPYYVENIYKLPVKNIIDYEKTLTVEEAIEQSKDNVPKEKKKFGLFKKKNRMQDVIFDDEENNNDNPKNQILNYKK
jgi:hypothetical protein